jgi:stage V sporulation protein D (sporulation-specific penicillin-binding protein)
MTPDTRNSFDRRALASRIIAASFCAAILVKLGVEQTYLRRSRLELAAKIVPSPRGFEPGPGPICALGGEHLADSVVRYTIWVDPAAYHSDDDRRSVAELLSSAANLPFTRVYPQVARQDRRFCYILRRTDREAMARVASLDLPGVHILPEIGRVYPFGRLAANAIGCRGADNQGLEGLEGLWSFVLDGQSGGRRPDQDYCGRTILGASEQGAPDEPGCRIILTIHLPLQKVVEAAMDDLWKKHQPESATCTVLDPRTGDILALASRPNYDPNDLRYAIPEKRKCRQASDVYSPGSTLKTVMIAAALDAGVINENSRFYCSGTTEIGGKPLGCWGEWRAKGHGWLTPDQVIAKSCNVCAAQIAMRLGADRLYSFIHRMHLEETLSSGLGAERPGAVLPKDQQRIRGIANIGFGQSIDVTDLHMVTWYGALANQGRMYYPNMVREVRTADGRLLRRRAPLLAGQLVKPETARLCLSYLEGAVEHGTGTKARIPGVRVGGKTGTAQIYDIHERKYLENQYIMSFMAVAPIDSPRFVVFVRVTKPKLGEHGSDTSAPTAKRVLEAALRLSEAELAQRQPAVEVQAGAPKSAQNAG